MTSLVERPNSSRGQRRREELIDAGVALLSQGGWPALTTRAVAERASANQGLIHYHFGGLPGLHVAIAQRAGDMIIGPVVDVILEAVDVEQAFEAMRGVLVSTADNNQVTSLAVELIAGAMREEAIGDVFRCKLAEARAQLIARLGVHYPELSREHRTGWAVLVAALIDGLMLHTILDSNLPADAALNTLRDVVMAGSDRGESR